MEKLNTDYADPLVPAGARRTCAAMIVFLWLFGSLSGLSFGQQADDTTSGSESTGDSANPTLAEILLGNADQGMLSSESMPAAADFPPPKIDEAKLKGLGLRNVAGQYISIWTDLPQSPGVDLLATQFDNAVAEWSRYFQVDDSQLAAFKLTGYVMKNERTFKQAGLVPRNLPPFLHGFQRGYELWIRDQPSDYYRRHLLLHEGVHGFMNILLGGTGPPWYREGMAEHLATHRIENGRMRIGVMPKSRQEVPYWGRIKIIQEQFAADEGKMLNEIMQLGNDDFLTNTGYAWAWGAVAFLDGHPVYKKPFRQMRQHLKDNPVKFSQRFLDQVAARLRQFDEQWQLFVVNVDYGYDFAAEAVEYGVGLPIPMSGREVKIKVNRGWQSSGARLVAGNLYRISAEGQFQLRQSPEVWWSEPGGVTIEYYDGMPLGMLMGSVRLDESQPGVANLASPVAIGRQRHIRPLSDGTLYLRVNDIPSEIRENVGEVTVSVTQIRQKREPAKTSKPSATEE